MQLCLSSAVLSLSGSSEKVSDYMKGIKLGITGICVSLLGIAFALNNFVAIVATAIGLLLAIVGCCLKDS